MNNNYYKKILAKLLANSVINASETNDLIENMFEDEDFAVNAKKICDDYIKKENSNAKLLVRTINTIALPTLLRITDRENLGIIPIMLKDEYDMETDTQNTNILFLSTQENQINLCILEALSLTGVKDSLKMEFEDIFAKKIQKQNPLIKMTLKDEKSYKKIKDVIKSLPIEMRFTLFPSRNENGDLDIAFFTKTEEFLFQNKRQIEKRGPYLIPKILSITLACSLLEDPDLDEKYEEIKMEKKRFKDELLRFYYEQEQTFYLVPCVLKSEKNMSVFMDRKIEINPDKTDYFEYADKIENEFNGLNKTFIPFNRDEVEMFKNDVLINKDQIDFLKNTKCFSYAEPEVMKNKDISEKLIDVVNKNRQLIMCYSTDFNANNFANIEDYVYGTVQEMILREDEEYFEYTDDQTLTNERQAELLNKLKDNYQIQPVYIETDGVSKEINEAKLEIENRGEIKPIAISKTEPERE